jgi:aminopeptidase N
MKTRAILLVALVLAALPAAAQRLSGDVVPEHYDLWFGPDLERAVFDGRATIRVQLRTASSAITLHAAELDLREVTIAAGGRAQTAQVTLHPDAETATLRVPDPIPAGPATIEIAYAGILNDKLRGFYLSRANGRNYAITQLEPTSARRAFPSFDEPIYKATFEISLTVDAGDTAISNAAQVSDTPGPVPGTHTLRFAPTPKMSTYLVAMIVGDFECREGGADGTPIRICATPDKLGLTRFALEAAEQQLAFFNRYFGIPYAFGKLDIVAVPDFAAGAMENAGAVTFRERLLLVDEERASVNVLKRVASVISHELAHQWFGNLVTMKWWDDIWLNEGFATWVASKPIAEWRPEWNVRLDEAAETQTALALDALRTTRATRFSVETPDEINEVFDAIAFQKTAGVLRMVEGFIGPEPFRRGIVSYLRRYSYSNAAGEDFWSEMTRVTGRPVDAIMRRYVEQPGVPVVSVQTRCTETGTEVALEQERFVGTPDGERPEPQLWTVPVCIRPTGGEPRCEVLDRRRKTLTLSGCGGVFANADALGYYFTEYEPDGVRALAAGGDALDPVERISLLGDEWWMVRGGRHDIGSYLDLAASMAEDETAAVTDAMAGRLTFTGEYVIPGARRAAYERWIRTRFGPALDALGLPGEAGDSEERQRRRAELLMLVGVAGDDAGVQLRARELAASYISNPASLPGTLVPAVLRVGALGGDAALYERYVTKLETVAAQPEEYYRFFGALPWFRDPALVRRTLAFAISPAVRTQDSGMLIAEAISQPWSRETAWGFVRERWDTLRKQRGTFQSIPMIVTALGGFCSAARAMEVRAFYAANPVPSAERALRQSIDRIESCAALVARQSAPLAAWLGQGAGARRAAGL